MSREENNSNDNNNKKEECRGCGEGAGAADVYNQNQNRNSRRGVVSLCRFIIYRGQILLPIPSSISNSQHPILNRTRTQMMQHHMARNRQHTPIIRQRRHIIRVDGDHPRVAYRPFEWGRLGV